MRILRRGIEPISAFSLLEVVLALGIFALAVIALVGLSGPLLSDLQNERREGELENVLAATRAWVAREAHEDFAAFRGELSGGRRELVAFLLEPLEEDGPAGWRIGTTTELDGFLDLNDATTAVRGPSVFALVLEVLPAPSGEPERGYLPLKAELREQPVARAWHGCFSVALGQQHRQDRSHFSPRCPAVSKRHLDTFAPRSGWCQFVSGDACFLPGGTDSRRSAAVGAPLYALPDRREPVPPVVCSFYRDRTPLWSSAGFTVLEILVASAILVVIVGMVMGLTGMVMRAWNQGTSALDRDAQLQQAYQLFQYDLETAVITPDDRPWLWWEETAGGGLSLRWLVRPPMVVVWR